MGSYGMNAKKTMRLAAAFAAAALAIMMLGILAVQPAHATQTAKADTSLTTAAKKTADKSGIKEGAFIIHSLLKGSKAIEIASGSSKAGVQALVAASNDALPQRFYLRRVGTDTFMIQSVASGLYLTDVKGKVKQTKRTNAAKQQWKAAIDGKGITFTNLGSGKRMAVSKGRLVTAKAKNANAQRFSMEQTQLLPDGFYQLLNAASGRALDLADGLTASGTNIQIFDRNTTGAQTWIFHSMGNGWYQLENNGSWRLVGVESSSKKALADVRQYPYKNKASRQWKPVLLENGGFVFVNKHSRKVLEAAGKGNRANVRQNVRKDTALQTWKLADATPISLSGDATLDAYIRTIASRNDYDLYSCFVDLMSMRAVNALDDEIYCGIVGKSTITKYATLAMERNASDCYGGAALLTYVARACGYQAQFRAGYVASEYGPEEHGWTEVRIDGQVYVCDVSLGRYIYYRNWYLVTYDDAPATYLFSA